VIRAAAITLALTAALLIGAAPGQAADECKGLQACIPIPGPWVVVPAPGGLATATSWQIRCPQGIAGGTDARVSDKQLAVDFPGRIGSPVNPGITTSDRVAFRGTYVGIRPRVTTYKPFVGCIPTTGGGSRTRTSFQRVTAVKPGEPITFRVKTLSVNPGTLARASLRCKPNERLLAGSHAVGLYTEVAPPRAQLNAVRVVRVRRGNQILVSVTRRGLEGSVGVEVQVQAVCAR
jgi:hypothetical protein